MTRSLVTVALLAAAHAHAWEVVAQVSLRVSSEMSAPMFGASTQASSEASTRASSKTDQAQTSDASGAQQQQQQPQPQPREAPPPEPRPATAPEEPEDVSAEDAAEERPMMLWRRATELYLRGHASQLKQDVALGKGPVISALAAAQKVSPEQLGPLLRANHRELLALIGDPADTAWPQRFLKRVDAVLHS